MRWSKRQYTAAGITVIYMHTMWLWNGIFYCLSRIYIIVINEWRGKQALAIIKRYGNSNKSALRIYRKLVQPSGSYINHFFLRSSELFICIICTTSIYVKAFCLRRKIWILFVAKTPIRFQIKKTTFWSIINYCDVDLYSDFSCELYFKEWESSWM